VYISLVFVGCAFNFPAQIHDSHLRTASVHLLAVLHVLYAQHYFVVFCSSFCMAAIIMCGSNCLKQHNQQTECLPFYLCDAMLVCVLARVLCLLVSFHVCHKSVFY